MYDPGAHLSHGDVAIDDPARTSLVQTKIKASNADPFQKGVTVYMGQTGNDLCLVAAITAYLQPNVWPVLPFGGRKISH